MKLRQSRLLQSTWGQSPPFHTSGTASRAARSLHKPHWWRQHCLPLDRDQVQRELSRVLNNHKKERKEEKKFFKMKKKRKEKRKSEGKSDLWSLYVCLGWLHLWCQSKTGRNWRPATPTNSTGTHWYDPATVLLTYDVQGDTKDSAASSQDEHTMDDRSTSQRERRKKQRKRKNNF